MANIDERIVSMKFDNKQFEQGTETSIKSLNKLNDSLKLQGATKGLDAVDAKAKGLSFSNIANGVEALSNRFTVLGTVGINVLSNIANQAVSAGARLVKSFTLEPVIAGFQEYETQMNAVQTILANTASKGSTLKDVNASLDQLNTYADKTIYNFTEMTRNIGTFTAAGVDLKTATSSIQGIANLAAVSGSTSQQASTAMYQLSQAMAAGTVKLMDWNSVVNAGMGGQVFQDALVRTSENLKTGAKAAIKTKGSFRESLQTGWLTSEVLTKTLDQFSLSVDTAEDYNNSIKSLVSQGYTQQEAKAIADMAKTAGDAATKVKTFSQLMDTLKEATGSGWTNTWEILIGDFEEAKKLFTNVSNVLGKIINDSSKARNDLLQGFVDLGGRQDIIDAIANAFNGMMKVMGAVGKAFRSAFPPTTSKNLKDISNSIKEFSERLIPTEETITKLTMAFKGIFAIFSIGKQAISAIAHGIMELISAIAPGAGGFLDMAAGIGDTISSVDQAIKKYDIFGKIVDKIVYILKPLATGLGKIAQGFGAIVGGGFLVVSRGMETMTSGLKAGLGVFDSFGNALYRISSVLGVSFNSAGELVKTFAGEITKYLGNALKWVHSNFSLGDIFNIAAGGLVIKSLMSIDKIIGKFKDTLTKTGEAKSQFADLLGSLGDTIKTFQTGIKVTSLVAIAAAISLLVGAVEHLSAINPAKMTTAIAGIGTMMAMLTKMLVAVNASLVDVNTADLFKTSVALMAIGKSIDILANAVVKIAGVSLWGMIKGLAATMAMLKGMSTFLSKSNFQTIGLKTSIGMLAIAKSLEMMSGVLTKLGGLNLKSLGKGLAGLGVMLGEMSAAMMVVGRVRVPISSSLALLAIAQAATVLTKSLVVLSKLSWKGIAKGLTALGGALTELVAAMIVVGKTGSVGNLIGGLGLDAASKSLYAIGTNLVKVAGLSWDGIAKGLTGLGGALAELSAAIIIVGKIGGVGSIVGAAGILLVAQALSPIGDVLTTLSKISWNGIGKGLTALGGALLELGAVITIIGTVNPVGAIAGAAAIVLVSLALKPIGDVLTVLGHLSWEGVGKGLTALGGALLELGAVITIIGTVNPVGAIAGAAAILLASQSLGKISDALIKFSSMPWESVKKGLINMGAALGELAIGGIINTFSGLGSISIATVAGPLGTLADSIMKFNKVKISPNLIVQLSQLAGGIMTFTFAGFGSGALAKAAPAIGVLGESISKWKNVKVPKNIGKDMGDLAGGVKAFTWALMGGASLAASAGSLGTLADSVNKWGEVKVPKNFGKSLTTIADGVKAFSWAFMGGWSLTTVIGPLSDLAKSVNSWANVKIPKNFTQSLRDIAEGVNEFMVAFIGGWSMGQVTGPLKDLAGSISAWNGVKIPNGLKSGLKDIAEGIQSFSWMLTEGFSLRTIVGPLGALANSMRLWSGVTVPKNISASLTDIATGVQAFNFALPGGLTIALLGDSLGRLAMFVALWSGLYVPKDIGTSMSSIADGVKAFSFALPGGMTIALLGDNLGKLATNVQKWSSVTINTADVKGMLTNIAEGVKEFGLKALVGDFSISQMIGPLGDLAPAVQKWSSVKINTSDVKGMLSNIAQGVQEFAWLFTAGWSLGTITGPLGDLASATSKWANVKVPKDIEGGLASIARGIQNFQWAWQNADGLSSVTAPLGAMAGAVNKWKDVTIPTGLEAGLAGIARGISSFTQASEAAGLMPTISSALAKLAGGLVKLNGIDTLAIGVSLTNLVNSINAVPAIGTQLPAQISSLAGQLSQNLANLNLTVGSYTGQITGTFANLSMQVGSQASTLGSNIQRGMNQATKAMSSGALGISSAAGSLIGSLSSSSSGASSAMGQIKTAITTGLQSTINSINGMKGTFGQAGGNLANGMATGINNNSRNFGNSFTSNLGRAVNAIRGYNSSFYTAGSYLVDGFASGISDHNSKAYNAAYKMASEAAKAARKALDEHSPSKVFYKIGAFVVDGFANAVNENAKDAVNATNIMSTDVVDRFNASLNALGDGVDSNLDMTPTITPVLDLSQIKMGVNSMKGMLDASASVSASRSVDSYRLNTSRESVGSGSINAPTGGSITMTQNNYSPKALSRMEIYRNTNNQLRQLKGALNRK